MELKIFINNPWQENTIVLYDKTGEAVVIDCGCFNETEQDRLNVFFEQKGLKPVALLCTHLHIDHILGNRFMKEVYGLEAQASADDNFLIKDAISYAAMLGLRGVAQPPELGKTLKDGDTVRFGESELKVIAVAGHSPGGLCYYSEKDQLLIAGDVLFAGSIGRSDLPGGDGKTLIADIKRQLFVLPDDVKVIPGHGESTTIGIEKKENPFF